MNYKSPKFKTTYHETEHFKFAVHKLGHGDKHLMCIPPFPTAAVGYAYTFKHLKESEYTLILVEIPGIYGESEVKKDFSFKNLKVELEDTITKELKVSQKSSSEVHLLGNSYGASLIISFQEKLLERFDKVYIVSPVIYKLKGILGESLRLLLKSPYVQKLCGYLLSRKFEYFVNNFFAETFGEAQLEFLNTYSKSVDYQDMGKHLSNILSFDLREDIKKLDSVNAHVYYARSEDRTFRKQHQYFENSKHRIKLIEGVHYSFMSEPDLATRYIIN